ncbi:hypothetical protein L6164_004460 [Bauhinia variegata]|uniref:Uncharacterized protein n=1 Tax=Bauhinia variegata TaxID=167791 RepID=A0ACB9Q4R3_BAUVA|nr:hypothetical protein L6164_004460 [Bauhinia variegata]
MLFAASSSSAVEFIKKGTKMAKSLSNILLNLKGIAGLPAARSSSRPLTGSFYRYGTRYLTTVSNDPDTHDDFKPTNKLDSDSMSLADVVEQDVKDNPVMIYMKGVPDFPQCGFSLLAVNVLKQYDVPVSARNILEDPELKSAVKTFSNWPTFPQVFIKGEFIGGSDIVLNLHQTGELKEKLKDIRDKQEKNE